MKILLIALLINLLHYTTFSQTTDIIKAEEMNSPLHKKNAGRITFMKGNIPLAQYKESDFLTTFDLTRKSDLNIRVFMTNSITNYLHQLAPDLPPGELIKSGNFQFSFSVDGKFIYKENMHYGCNFGGAANKNTATTFRVPFTSTKGEDWWSLNLWERFKSHGGDEALTDGTHNLTVELRPYVISKDDDKVKIGELIASGQLKLNIATPVVTPLEISIQRVKGNDDWEISTAFYDQKKIEALNTAIATYKLKEITSIVVVKDGKLLIEEYFNAANSSTLHDTRSVGKSFASTMMGLAINEGYIKNEDQTLSSFYNLKEFENYSIKKGQVKIKDLLTMSSAFDGSDASSDSPGNEENMYPADNWVKFTLDLPMDSTKNNGGKWAYFTAGVVLLGDILNQSVPGGLEKYADEKLFKPLNIRKYQWQYTPQKVANTAGGLQLSSLSFAKYAELYQKNGKWKGQQIIPSAWIDKTFTHQVQLADRDNEFYGYLFWNKTYVHKGKNYEAYYCAGNGGNQIIVFKDLPVTIVITSKAYNKAYAHPQTDKIVNDYLLPALY